jgi:hypothetical protein
MSPKVEPITPLKKTEEEFELVSVKSNNSYIAKKYLGKARNDL